jgi:hypothetical protein
VPAERGFVCPQDSHRDAACSPTKALPEDKGSDAPKRELEEASGRTSSASASPPAIRRKNNGPRGTRALNEARLNGEIVSPITLPRRPTIFLKYRPDEASEAEWTAAGYDLRPKRTEKQKELAILHAMHEAFFKQEDSPAREAALQ